VLFRSPRSSLPICCSICQPLLHSLCILLSTFALERQEHGVII